MQIALRTLSAAQPSFFMVENHVAMAPSLSRVIGKFKDIVYAYLPADQGQLLMHAAAAVMELHAECKALKGRQYLQLEKKAIDMLDEDKPQDDSQVEHSPNMFSACAEKEIRSNVKTNSIRRRSDPVIKLKASNPEEEIPAVNSPSAVDTHWDSS